MVDQGSHGGRRSSDGRQGVATSGNGARGVAPEDTRANVGPMDSGGEELPRYLAFASAT